MIANEPMSSAPSLTAALAARARAASDGRLALDVGGGLVAALVIGIWRPSAWPIGVSAAIGLAAFGAWGIAEREIQERASDVAAGRRLVLALRVLQGISITAGILAAAVAGFALLAFALGTIIS
jgi:hypothetical protein